ncbi:MAG: tRNA-specific 2-thiouridylase [Hyphomonadaceae bacterium]|nr:MAG: tRNA-specific 2-thiouridylase [Hyphomonadaceae bacterium]
MTIPDIDLGFTKPRAQTRVVVAMSGGVDSSVCAALVHAAGYEVIGITLQLYDHGAAIAKKNACCAGQDIYDAKNIADVLGFPHYTLDYESRFRQSVMEDFADTYVQGATPIPCVRCNQSVKFTDLLELARGLGADCMVTGHYVARVGFEADAKMHIAKDKNRDQSYFLFATTQKQLDFLRFPLAEIGKDDVRKIALDFGLNVADKPDSQDICFVPDGKYQDIVVRLRPQAGKAGEIVHIDGRILGKHQGIINYTVGQRRGLGIAVGDPLFVVALDAEDARVIVGPKEALKVKSLTLKEVNWLGEKLANEDELEGRKVLARVRSTRPPIPATLSTNLGWRIIFDEAEEGVAPGQACVLYDPESAMGDLGERVLGGGFIASTQKLFET